MINQTETQISNVIISQQKKMVKGKFCPCLMPKSDQNPELYTEAGIMLKAVPAQIRLDIEKSM